MNVLDLVIRVVKARSPRAFVAWVALCFVTAFAYQAFGNRPLEASEIAGMALTWAVVVFLGWQVGGRLMRRRELAGPEAQSGKGSDDAKG